MKGIERRASNYGGAVAGTGKGVVKSAGAVRSGGGSGGSTGAGAMKGKTLQKPTSSVPVGGQKKKAGVVAVKSSGGRTNTGNAAKTAKTTAKTMAKTTAKTTAKNPSASLPKPYPNNKPFGTRIEPRQKPASSSASSTSTATKPKPFTPPTAPAPVPGLDKTKPYPGTTTLPGQGGKTPVRRQYKPLPKLGPQVGEGEKMVHIG